MATKRILIFNVNWLGDVLFSTAVIRNIRYNYPDSFIACAVPGRCRQVLEGNPYLDEIIIFDEKLSHKSMLSKLKFIHLLKSKGFSTVFLLHRSFSRALIVWFAGIRERIGYYTRKRGWLLTAKIMAPKKDSLHRADYYLELIKSSGLAVKDKFSDFFIGKEDLKTVDDFLKEHDLGETDFLTGINAGGNWGPKRWQKEYFAELADKLIKNFGAKVIITGGLEDLELAKQIQGLMKEKLIFACGAFSLKQSAALFKRLSIFITSDTGPLHIANAVGAKTIIALFGPTHPSITGPYPADNVIVLQKQVGCKIPCYAVDCDDNRCMKAISPEDVLEQVKRLSFSQSKK